MHNHNEKARNDCFHAKYLLLILRLDACREKVFGPTSFFVTSIQPLSYLRMMNVKIVDLNTPSASSPDLISSSVLVDIPSSDERTFPLMAIFLSFYDG